MKHKIENSKKKTPLNPRFSCWREGEVQRDGQRSYQGQQSARRIHPVCCSFQIQGTLGRKDP